MKLPIIDDKLCCYYCDGHTLTFLYSTRMYAKQYDLFEYRCERCWTEFSDGRDGVIDRVSFEHHEWALRLHPNKEITTISEKTKHYYGAYYEIKLTLNYLADVNPETAGGMIYKWMLLL